MSKSAKPSSGKAKPQRRTASADNVGRPSAADAGSAPDNATGSCSFYQPDASSLSQDNNVGQLLKRVSMSLTRMIDQAVSPLGLTAMQWKPLVLICHHNIDTPAELSRRIFVDSGAMTRTLDRLETKGFLTRHRCEQDRRVVKLELTDSGRQVVKQILPAVADSLNAHLTGFNPNETEQLLGFLRRMIANGTLDRPLVES